MYRCSFRLQFIPISEMLMVMEQRISGFVLERMASSPSSILVYPLCLSISGWAGGDGGIHLPDLSGGYGWLRSEIIRCSFGLQFMTISKTLIMVMVIEARSRDSHG